MALKWVITLVVVLAVPLAHAQYQDVAAGSDDDDESYTPGQILSKMTDAGDDDQIPQAMQADEVADQSPELPSGPNLMQQRFLHANSPTGPASKAVSPPGLAAAPAAAPTVEDTKTDALNAKQAASVAKQAAKVANKVAVHSMKITGHAKKALKHALGALHDARIDSSGLAKQQKESLKKAEAHLREATQAAEHGELKKVKTDQDVQKDKMEKDLKKNRASKSEKEQMREEIKELRKKLKEKRVDDKDIDKALDDLEADLDKTVGPINDESKAELERLRQLVDSLETPEEDNTDEGKDASAKRQAQAEKLKKPVMEPLQTKEDSGKDDVEPASQAVPVRGFDIDTAMPYGDLEPFGREDTAQELTESSISESNEMVDQLERAEVAEEKRSVFRALTRLRGAAITSFDGVARSQTGHIDEYNKIHKWRNTHPLHHLADEESDVSKWAFPDNAD